MEDLSLMPMGRFANRPYATKTFAPVTKSALGSPFRVQDEVTGMRPSFMLQNVPAGIGTGACFQDTIARFRTGLIRSSAYQGVRRSNTPSCTNRRPDRGKERTSVCQTRTPF